MTIPDGPLLVVSPHLDDAALSCAALLDRAEPLDVVTVCTGRPRPPRQGDWDRACGFADSDEAISARIEEERLAFAGTAHRLGQLGLFESQYLDEPRPDKDVDVLRRYVNDWVTRNGEGRVTVAVPACAGRVYHGLERVAGVPLGARRAAIKRLVGPIGRAILGWANRRIVLRDDPVVHGDHRFVRDAILDGLTELSRTRILLYEEVPYLWGHPADDEVARTSARYHLRATEIRIPVRRDAKASRVGAYRSQLPHLYRHQGHALDSVEGLPPVERYWLLQP